jgi:hypothetical protein
MIKPQWSPALAAGVSAAPVGAGVDGQVAAMESGLDGRSQLRRRRRGSTSSSGRNGVRPRWPESGICSWRPRQYELLPQWSPALAAGVRRGDASLGGWAWMRRNGVPASVAGASATNRTICPVLRISPQWSPALAASVSLRKDPIFRAFTKPRWSSVDDRSQTTGRVTVQGARHATIESGLGSRSQSAPARPASRSRSCCNGVRSLGGRSQ